ncbi:MAG: LapA family protein, partial [Alkalispirochaetaceae bacterium]
MSSYDYYIWIRSLSDGLRVVLPLLIVAALTVGGLIGWRWWLRSRHGDPERVARLEQQLSRLEKRVDTLEKRG